MVIKIDEGVEIEEGGDLSLLISLEVSIYESVHIRISTL